jgi:hypothetical protein
VHELARGVDHHGVGGRVHRRAHRRDLAVAQEDRAVADRGAGAVMIVALRITTGGDATRR